MPGRWFLLVYLHVLAAGLYIGGAISFGGALIPGLRAGRDRGEWVAAVAGVARIYHPISLLALGALVMTGAYYLTGLKASLGPLFFPRLIRILGPKLLVAFILIMLASYEAFALGVRLCRALERDGGRPAPARLPAYERLVRRMRATALLGALLAAVNVYLGLLLARAG